jgi:hypothetical protein
VALPPEADWSALAVARVRPPGLNATEVTALVWPVRTALGLAGAA